MAERINSTIYITGAMLADPVQKSPKPKDILLLKGKIEAIGKPGELASKAKSLKAKIIQAKGCIAAPGFVDLNAHVYEPGDESRESFASASAAGAAGGFTTIACMPCTVPINDNALVTDMILRRAKDKAKIRTVLIGALTAEKKGEKLSEIGLMTKAGVLALSDDGRTIMDSYLMRKALEYTKTFGLPIFSFAEDKFLVGQGQMHEGYNSNLLGLRGIPAAAEEIMVLRDLVLAKHTKGKIHFSSISTKGSIEAIRRAKEQGLLVTAETNPHYFTLDSSCIATYDANYKCFPPLRTTEDMEAIQEALADGTLDCIATHHSPQKFSDKDLDFASAAPGMISFETTLPLTLELVRKKKLTMQRLVELLSTNPAKILGLTDLGKLKEGSIADLVVFDPSFAYQYSEKLVRSACKNTPFLGTKLHGFVRLTIVNGSIVHEDFT